MNRATQQTKEAKFYTTKPKNNIEEGAGSGIQKVSTVYTWSIQAQVQGK
jgi:hypothetical protein